MVIVTIVIETVMVTAFRVAIMMEIVMRRLAIIL